MIPANEQLAKMRMPWQQPHQFIATESREPLSPEQRESVCKEARASIETAMDLALSDCRTCAHLTEEGCQERGGGCGDWWRGWRVQLVLGRCPRRQPITLADDDGPAA